MTLAEIEARQRKDSTIQLDALKQVWGIDRGYQSCRDIPTGPVATDIYQTAGAYQSRRRSRAVWR